MFYWYLSKKDIKLMMTTYREGKSIFVGPRGRLYPTNDDNYEEVNSVLFNTLEDYRFGIQKGKIVVYLTETSGKLK